MEALALMAATWAFGIGNGNLDGGPAQVADRLAAYDVVVVDGEEASAAEVSALSSAGVVVLAYLSVGTIERWRGWYPRVKRYRLSAWKDWKGEWFADVSRKGLRTQLLRRVAPAILDKGFDGLFLDNVDMIEPKRHRGQRKGMRRLVAGLNRLLGDERFLFAQNGEWGMRRFGIVRHLDGWNREDVTWTYDFDRRRYVRNRRADTRAALRELVRMRERGLLVTATDYTMRGSGSAVDEAVENACSAGALPFVSNIGLTAARLPDPPLAC